MARVERSESERPRERDNESSASATARQVARSPEVRRERVVRIERASQTTSRSLRAIEPRALVPWRSLPKAVQAKERAALADLTRAVAEAPNASFRLGFEYEGSNLQTALHYFRPPAAALARTLDDAFTGRASRQFLLSQREALSAQGQQALASGDFFPQLSTRWYDLVGENGTRLYLQFWQKHFRRTPVAFSEWQARLPTLPPMFKPKLADEVNPRIYELKTRLGQEMTRERAMTVMRVGYETVGKAPQHTHAIFAAPAPPADFARAARPWLQQRSLGVTLAQLTSGSDAEIGERLIDDHFRRAIVANPEHERGNLRLRTSGLDPDRDGDARYFSIEVRGNTPAHVAAFGDVLAEIHGGFAFGLAIDAQAWRRFVAVVAPFDPATHFAEWERQLHRGVRKLQAVPFSEAPRLYGWNSNDKMEETIDLLLTNPELGPMLGAQRKVAPYSIMLPAMPWEILFPGGDEIFAHALADYNHAIAHAHTLADLGRAFRDWERATGCVAALREKMQKSWPIRQA